MSKVKCKKIKEQYMQDLPYSWYNSHSGLPVRDVINHLESFISKYGEEATMVFSFFQDDYLGDSFELIVNYERMETQEEANKRAERNRKARETRERNKIRDAKKKREREMKELKRLKKKYGEA
jgi:hypothetical protein